MYIVHMQVEMMIYPVSFKRLWATPTTLAELECVILNSSSQSQASSAFHIYILYGLTICYFDVHVHVHVYMSACACGF